MQKLVFLLLFTGICFTTIAQKTAASKDGVCKVMKVSPDKEAKSKITFRFIGPTGKPAANRLTFRVDETMVDPSEAIDKKNGIYVMTVEPGSHTFNFYVPYWKDVNSKPITFKPKTNTEIFVKFVPEEYGSGAAK